MYIYNFYMYRYSDVYMYIEGQIDRYIVDLCIYIYICIYSFIDRYINDRQINRAKERKSIKKKFYLINKYVHTFNVLDAMLQCKKM